MYSKRSAVAVLISAAMLFLPRTAVGAGGCIPHTTNQVAATTTVKNITGIEPMVMVEVGTQVHLIGIAQSETFDANCTSTKTQLPFKWALSFQAPGQMPTNPVLSDNNTLTPQFNADARGIYTALLEASGFESVVRIETIAPKGWYSLGPYGYGAGNTGRINTLAFDAKSGFLYAGTALGGVFKSTDEGATWTPMTDHKGLPTLAIGALAVGPDSVIYAGTGDLHSNDNGLFQSGSGIWKSGDGGVTWTPAGTNVGMACPGGTVAFTGNAAKIVVHPNKPNVVYVAGNQGVLRSTDGGACWTSILNVSASDIMLDPSAPTTLYVGTPGQQPPLLKTMNAEDVAPLFAKLTIPLADKYSFIALAVAPTTPQRIYAAFGLDSRTDILRSSDGGGTWTQLPSQDACAGQCAYDMALAVSPTDPDRVVYGQRYPTQSTDGGAGWIDLRSESGHADYHAIVFSPKNPSELFAANDGGVYRIVLPPKANPAPLLGWEPRNVGLAVTQAVGLAIAPSSPRVSTLGAWDNGSQSRFVGRQWTMFGGGDGFYAAIDADPKLTFYYSGNAGIGGNLARFDGKHGVDVGISNGFSSNPYKVGELASSSANDRPGSKFYVAEQANADPKLDWRCADPDPDINNAASAWDFEFGPNGVYYATHTDGSIWRFSLAKNRSIKNCAANATNAQGATRIFKSPNPASIRTTLDPFPPEGLYAVIGNSKDAGRVLHLTKAQGQWTATPLAGVPGQAGALPDVLSDSDTISADPLAPDIVYVGTHHGLWQGNRQGNGSYEWVLNQDMPDTWVFGIVAHQNLKAGFSKVLRLTTYGRGIWERYPPAAELTTVPPVIPCFNCGIINLPPWKDGPVFRLSVPDSVAWVAVPYTFDGPAGSTAKVQVSVLNGGVPQRFFITEPQRVGPGGGVVPIQIRYGQDTAPLGLHTDALRVSVVPENRSRDAQISSTTYEFDYWWLRPEAHLLQIGAGALDPGPAQIETRINLASDSAVTKRDSGTIEVPVRSGAAITVDVLPRVPLGTRNADFQVWTVNDRLAGTEPRLRLKVEGNTRIVAHYKPNTPAEQLFEEFPAVPGAPAQRTLTHPQGFVSPR
jgi:hypothetical protein